MKKDAQLGNEIKKLQYQLSYSEHISTSLLIQTSNSQNSWPLLPTKPAFLYEEAVAKMLTSSIPNSISRNYTTCSLSLWLTSINFICLKRNSTKCMKIVMH
jgi:hypothetical protein